MKFFLAILTLAVLSFALPSRGQSAGDVQLGVKSSDGPLEPVWITKTAGKVIGWNGSGELGSITLTYFDGAFSSLTGKPTTLAGYGITDALSATIAAATYQPLIADGTLPLAKLATDPLARANHTGTQLLATISDAGALAALNAVASAQITDGTIVDADISSSAAISDGKIASSATWNAKENALTFSAPLSRSTNTISLATSGVTAGTYGSATQSARLVIDAYGRVTGASVSVITPADASIVFADVTTNNASATKHGFLPKLSGSASQYLDGTGAWSAPASGATLGANTFTGTQTTQAIVPSADDTYDIGQQYPGKRFREIQASGMVNCWYVRFGPSQAYIFPTITRGVWAFRFTNAAGDAATPLILGPQSAAWPALIPNGPELQIRLADDSGDAPLTTGDLTVGGGTKHAKIKSGVATLVGGTVTINDANVLETGTASTSSRIFITRMTDGGTVGTYSVTRSHATSFTVTSSSSTDTSTVSWLMLNP